MREICPLSGIRSCPLFGSCKCIASTGIAVGTATVVRYSGDVRYWECPLSEVPLYTLFSQIILLYYRADLLAGKSGKKNEIELLLETLSFYV